MADIQPIKILFIHPTYSFGGAERTAKNLFSGLNPEKFSVILVSSKKIASKISGPSVIKEVYVEDIGMDIWFFDFKRLVKDVKIVVSLIGKFNPDIVFGMMHYSSVVISLAKMFSKHKCLYVSSPRGPSTDYLKNCYSDSKQRIYLKILFNIFCRFSDYLIVPSKGTKYDCVKNYGAKDNSVVVIHNSVDIESILKMYNEPVDIKIDRDYFVIVSTGRLTPEKNLSLLLHAVSILKRSHKIKLLLIGDGNQRYILEMTAKEHGISEDVLFLGFQDNPYKFYKLADVYVHTCLVEGFGNVIIEAMACGLPVIATDCPCGPREIIEHGKNGFLVPLDDPEKLSDAIINLLENKQCRDDISAYAVERVKDFSIAKMVRAYEDFFSHILS